VTLICGALEKHSLTYLLTRCVHKWDRKNRRHIEAEMDTS